MSYAQPLWQEIYKNGTDLQVTDNGIVEAIYTIISMYNYCFLKTKNFSKSLIILFYSLKI